MGALAYNSSGVINYGGYFTSYTSGTGKQNEISGIGSASYGNFMGAWCRGEVYGLTAKGERYGMYIDGRTYTNDLIVNLENTGKNERTATYVPTSMTADIYMKGIGELKNGKASIKFDENYIDLISEKVPVIVTVTPIGECAGLHLTNLKTSGFAVSENQKGTSNLQFTWVAIATRKGYENPQNPQEILNSNFDEKIDGMMFNESDTENSAQPLWWDGKELKNTQIVKEKQVSKNESETPKHKTYEKNKKNQDEKSEMSKKRLNLHKN